MKRSIHSSLLANIMSTRASSSSMLRFSERDTETHLSGTVTAINSYDFSKQDLHRERYDEWKSGGRYGLLFGRSRVEWGQNRKSKGNYQLQLRENWVPYLTPLLTRPDFPKTRIWTLYPDVFELRYIHPNTILFLYVHIPSHRRLDRGQVGKELFVFGRRNHDSKKRQTECPKEPTPNTYRRLPGDVSPPRHSRLR